jgi:TRAP-type C4-dicarboxylate transport system substrate-binding protein
LCYFIRYSYLTKAIYSSCIFFRKKEVVVKKFLVIACCLIVVSVIAGCAQPAPTPEKPMELKLSTHHPPPSFLVKGVITPWKESIEKATNGRIKITVYAGETLVKMQDDYDSLVNGLSDLVDIAPGVTPGRFPLSEIDTLPMLFPTGAIAGRVHNELLLKYCVDKELSKVKYLFNVSLPPMQFLLGKPVQKLEDMKGLKMRIEGKVEGWTMEALGATGVLLSTGEMSTSLERGLIDGTALVWEGALAFGIPQITKYRLQCDIYTRCFPMLMNKNAWDKLPSDIKKIFEDNSGPEASAKYGAMADGAMDGAKQAIIGMDKKAGNPDIAALSVTERARWEKALLPVWDRWITERKSQGLPAREMLDDALKLIKQYSK